jgi:hypothetical protein
MLFRDKFDVGTKMETYIMFTETYTMKKCKHFYYHYVFLVAT